jgi:hypothetical protein
MRKLRKTMPPSKIVQLLTEIRTRTSRIWRRRDKLFHPSTCIATFTRNSSTAAISFFSTQGPQNANNQYGQLAPWIRVSCTACSQYQIYLHVFARKIQGITSVYILLEVQRDAHWVVCVLYYTILALPVSCALTLTIRSTNCSVQS